MQNLFTLYQYIKNKYHNYQKIKYTETELMIVFYNEFEMKIRLQGYYAVFFNDIFYYDIDWQDIKDTIDDVFTGKYAFCERNGKIKIIDLNDYHESKNYNHVWTIERILK